MRRHALALALLAACAGPGTGPSTEAAARGPSAALVPDRGVPETTTTVVPAQPAPTTRPAARASRSKPTPKSLERIKQCESGGDYTAVSPSGRYRGAYQFDQRTWESVGGTGDPAAASPAEQDARAAELQRRRGSAPWPNCGR